MITPKPLKPYVHPQTVVGKIAAKDLAGLKVLFINMPLRESARPNCLPNGVCLLAAQLEKYNVEPLIVDLNAYRLKENGRQRGLSEEEMQKLLMKYFSKYGDQDLILLSGMITTLKWQERAAKFIRRHQPHAFLVSGNGLATEFKGGLFNWIPELDGVGHSEGDLSIIKIAFDAAKIKEHGFQTALQRGCLEPYHIGEHLGRHRFIYDGGRPSSLDDVPLPDYELLREDINGYPVLENYLQNEIWGITANNSSATPFTMRRSINTISSRGCPYACKYCYRGATGERNYGVRAADRLGAELEFYHTKYGVDFVGILDDNFLVQRNRIAQLPGELKGFVERSGLRWGTHGRLDEAADLRPNGNGKSVKHNTLRVDQMAQAGCVYIGFGAESADKRSLEYMGKGGFILANGTEKINGWEFPVTMIEGIKNTKHAGIHANCTWIMGYPGETLEMLKTSVAFIKWQEEFYSQFGDRPDSVNKNMFVATAYPGTEMFGHPAVKKQLHENFGIAYDEENNPICDENLHYYVLELDDATKVMHDQSGQPLNFGKMPMDQFLRAREHIASGQIYKILDM
ncbi:MAG: radical SAM protein [Deltaproteobacteria bacterium]|nr:radical SAM protein [Deltaproteobacteria bacterium]MBI4223349.1 radical SAM protein [Deltaproteobacteria bacterium]